MKAQDIMTKDVVTVGPNSTVSQIASLLVRHRISAVPVVEGDHQVIGIVSESDFLHRAETNTERKRKWWFEFLATPESYAREYIKTHGVKAKDVMSRIVVSVPYDAELAEVADVLDRHSVRRVPVLDEGKLVGIISRSDLVRAFTTIYTIAPAERPGSGALQKAIREELRQQPWLDTLYLNITVKGGVVELAGFVESNELRQAVCVLVEGVPGVQKVKDRLHLRPIMTAAG